MSFTSSQRQPQPRRQGPGGSTKDSRDTDVKSSKRETSSDKKSSARDETLQKRVNKDKDVREPPTHTGNKEDAWPDGTDQKRKKKRKRGQVEDLRFQAVEEPGIKSRRKERKKERKKERDAKKKKQKQAKDEDKLDFPRHEKIKFGDIVEAPPKLIVPKGLKTPVYASQERIRLQAVEAYRNRKGWGSRPGGYIPPIVDTLLQS